MKKQRRLESDLKAIRKWLQIKRTKRNNIYTFCNVRENVITLFLDFTTIVSEAKHRVKQGK